MFLLLININFYISSRILSWNQDSTNCQDSDDSMAVYIGLFPDNNNYKLWTKKHIYVYFYVSSYQLRAGRTWSWYYTFQIGNTLGEIHI